MLTPEETAALTIEFNSEARAWAAKQRDGMKSLITQLGVVESGELKSKLGFSVKKNIAGEVDRVTFRFPSQGLFSILGVGRGYPLERASSAKAILTGTGRKSKDFLNPILDTGVPELADIVARYKADHEVKSFQIPTG